MTRCVLTFAALFTLASLLVGCGKLDLRQMLKKKESADSASNESPPVDDSGEAYPEGEDDASSIDEYSTSDDSSGEPPDAFVESGRPDGHSSQQPAADGAKFHLSTGTALPQTLPEGEALGVSVEYQLTGAIDPAARYALVVERGHGPPATIPFAPRQSDTIGTFLRGWKSTQTPFRCYVIEVTRDDRRKTVSNTEPLR